MLYYLWRRSKTGEYNMINTTRLRKIIGWLAISLSVIVMLLSVCFGYGFPDSISATYYFDTCVTPFIIILGSAGVLLFSYRGYDLQDDIVCTIAGVFALLICLFPCATTPVPILLVGTFHVPVALSGIIHNVSAAIFFGLLAYNSLFLFTKSGEHISESKRKRNIIFRVCGIGMLVSFVAIPPAMIFNIHGLTWAVEFIALGFFGVSWLTKANCYKWLFAEPDRS